jgi:hypothetical protein
MEQIPRFMKIHNDRFHVFWGPDRMGWVASRDMGAAAATVLREGPMKHSGQNYSLSIELSALIIARARLISLVVPQPSKRPRLSALSGERYLQT